MNRHQPNHSRTSSTSSDTSSSSLPFPAPLPRSDFLAPDFTPSTYLSSLGHRHQTLEDLRADLRARSQQLSQELLDLVNNHYDEFLSLGGSLKGGQEKVEELRVGLMGLEKEVRGVKERVGEREGVVRRLLVEKRGLRRQMERGRRLLEWNKELESLERRLMLGAEGTVKKEDIGSEESSEESEDESDIDGAGLDLGDDEDDAAEYEMARLRKRVRDFAALKLKAERISVQHPFIVAQQARMARVKNTVLLDLSTELKHTVSSQGGNDAQRNLQLMGLYRELDAAHEAVEVIKKLPK
ncbi:MAG: hypothetical protein M1831_001262 [Alyxoria varia]|nr:MAG: hypothetical protein M1831_001262 [Alyxoria varia]